MGCERFSLLEGWDAGYHDQIDCWEYVSMGLLIIETQAQWMFSRLEGEKQSLFFSYFNEYQTSEADQTEAE